jgi:hypothetical protein
MSLNQYLEIYDSPQQTAHKKMRFDTTDTIDVPNPSITPSNIQHKPKGKRLSLKDQTLRDLSLDFVSHQLQALKSSLTPCCVLACFTWLTVAIVLGCRAQYLGLPTHKERHVWLDEKLEKMKKKSSASTPYSETYRYNYVIDCFGYEDKPCCVRAFDFAYGISPTTHKKQSSSKTAHSRRPRQNAKKRPKIARWNASVSGETYFANWLKLYANDFGDPL